ncbi:class I SAM-dependent methyltransferase [Marinobacter sp. R17]|uniref:class I SAM-dependent methyltransferase n=1 Tax=Marinobacter TaxID=2742 RepID=UPI000F4B0223|nr:MULTISPECIES: class I SAM-dependent methyltransferase [Marinobacter]ROT99863.1 class I SAM-dependent methyltransferase [Marinobacter sp. R17]
MSLYEDHVLPHLINRACSIGPVMKLRQQLVPQARGDVLEVGMGSGVNLQYYNPDRVNSVWGLEPSEGMRRIAARNVAAAPVEVKWLDLPGERIPLEDNSVDTVLLTFTLCTIPDWFQALQQMKRVLKPDGQLLFCEHGRAPEPGVRKWQDRLTPAWRKVAGGCHLNRPITRLLESAGFEIESADSLYIQNTPKIAGFVTYGVARKPE